MASGARFRLSGRIIALPQDRGACANGVRVVIKRNIAGGAKTFTRFKTDRTSSAGRYKTRVKTTKSAGYRASVRKAGRCDRAVSKSRFVRRWR